MIPRIFLNLHLVERADLAALMRADLEAAGTRAGAYRLLWYVAGRGRPIPRLGGEDREGVLYIGRSRDVAKRSLMLFDSLRRPGCRSHPVGVRYPRAPVVQELIPLSEMVIELRPTAAPNAMERDLLQAYVASFQEGPPWIVRTLQ